MIIIINIYKYFSFFILFTYLNLYCFQRLLLDFSVKRYVYLYFWLENINMEW